MSARTLLVGGNHTFAGIRPSIPQVYLDRHKDAHAHAHTHAHAQKHTHKRKGVNKRRYWHMPGNPQRPARFASLNAAALHSLRSSNERPDPTPVAAVLSLSLPSLRFNFLFYLLFVLFILCLVVCAVVVIVVLIIAGVCIRRLPGCLPVHSLVRSTSINVGWLITRSSIASRRAFAKP